MPTTPTVDGLLTHYDKYGFDRKKHPGTGIGVENEYSRYSTLREDAIMVVGRNYLPLTGYLELTRKIAVRSGHAKAAPAWAETAARDYAERHGCSPEAVKEAIELYA